MENINLINDMTKTWEKNKTANFDTFNIYVYLKELIYKLGKLAHKFRSKQEGIGQLLVQSLFINYKYITKKNDKTNKQKKENVF